MSVLVIADHLDGVLRDGTREAVGAGASLGGPVEVAVIAPDPAALAATAAGIDGVARVLAVAGPLPGEADRYESAVAALVEARGPRIVLASHASDALGWAAGVAARLGLGFASDVLRLADEGGAPVATRALHGGKVEAEIDFPGRERVLVTLRGGAFPAAGDGASAPVEEVAVDAAGAVRHLALVPAPTGDVDITQAPFLLSVGRGIGEEGALEQFSELAEKLGAVLSVSRPIVDAGWADAARQVGQSGKTVAPKVYLALGISGAAQHLAGIRGAECVIAVNTDPEAPIFGVATYGATCDIFDLADELEDALG